MLKDVLNFSSPAGRFEESCLIGNGKLGACVRGGKKIFGNTRRRRNGLGDSLESQSVDASKRRAKDI